MQILCLTYILAFLYIQLHSTSYKWILVHGKTFFTSVKCPVKVACNHSLTVFLYTTFVVEGHDSFNYWFWTRFVLWQHASKRSSYCRFWKVWWVGCFVSELCGREILSELLSFFCWVHETSSEKGWTSKEEWWEKLSISLILLVESPKRCSNF